MPIFSNCKEAGKACIFVFSWARIAFRNNKAGYVKLMEVRVHVYDTFGYAILFYFRHRLDGRVVRALAS